MENAFDIINNTKGKIFHVTFIKKDGTERKMQARTGVKSYLKGGKLKYNPNSHHLMSVFDMQKQEYRMVNTNTIIRIKANNKEYKFD